ncbi:hypothetical protein [Tumebacillus algifaecis]|uniref:hypothetical protein n=1 Tax=Tumebacillus algifaecis TaxID=1214604 RepID=UPI0012FD06F0|nr:hypothetical protein [Tumebacillus algifaecis]
MQMPAFLTRFTMKQQLIELEATDSVTHPLPMPQTMRLGPKPIPNPRRTVPKQMKEPIS